MLALPLDFGATSRKPQISLAQDTPLLTRISRDDACLAPTIDERTKANEQSAVSSGCLDPGGFRVELSTAERLVSRKFSRQRRSQEPAFAVMDYPVFLSAGDVMPQFQPRTYLRALGWIKKTTGGRRGDRSVTELPYLPRRAVNLFESLVMVQEYNCFREVNPS